MILSHCLQCSHTYLMTWPDKIIEQDIRCQYENMIKKRKAGHPVAHIVGFKGFWTLELAVNATTLIPRPETELLVEEALQLPLPDKANVLDLGTGTGAIALALASERPDWTLTGVDLRTDAVKLAQLNAQSNQLQNVEFFQSDWFSQLGSQRFDLIISNPPYVEEDSPYLVQGDVRFEPLSALTAGTDGLDDIKRIVSQASEFLVKDGWILFEHGFSQPLGVSKILTAHGFDNVMTKNDLNNLPRLTLGRNNN